MDRETAEKSLNEQIEKGKQLKHTSLINEDHLDAASKDWTDWIVECKELLRQIFLNDELIDYFGNQEQKAKDSKPTELPNLTKQKETFLNTLEENIQRLEKAIELLEIYEMEESLSYGRIDASLKSIAEHFRFDPSLGKHQILNFILEVFKEHTQIGEPKIWVFTDEEEDDYTLINPKQTFYLFDKLGERIEGFRCEGSVVVGMFTRSNSFNIAMDFKRGHTGSYSLILEEQKLIAVRKLLWSNLGLNPLEPDEIAPFDLSTIVSDPELLKRCIPQLEARDYFEAVRIALGVFERRIRSKSKNKDGKLDNICAELFSPEKGTHRFPFCKDEGHQKGMMFLYQGMVLSLRNPTHHQELDFSREDAANIIGFVNYLLSVGEKAEPQTHS